MHDYPPPRTPNGRLALLLKFIARTQKQVAEELGISASHLSQQKTGARDLSESLALKMQQTFGVSAGWLLNGTGHIFDDPERASAYFEFVLQAVLPDDEGRADVVLWDAKGNRAALEMTEKLPWDRAERRRKMRMAKFELRNYATNTSIRTLTEEAGAFLQLPDFSSGEYYCLGPAPDRCGIRPDEYLLLEARPADAWEPTELDGGICVASTDNQRAALFGLVVHRDREPAEVELLPQEESAHQETVPWDRLRVLGRVVLVFRTEIQVDNDQARKSDIGQSEQEDGER